MSTTQNLRGKVQASIVQTTDSMRNHADEEAEPVGENYLRLKFVRED
jgi:hypothetical protein